MSLKEFCQFAEFDKHVEGRRIGKFNRRINIKINPAISRLSHISAENRFIFQQSLQILFGLHKHKIKWFYMIFRLSQKNFTLIVKNNKKIRFSLYTFSDENQQKTLKNNLKRFLSKKVSFAVFQQTFFSVF